MTVADLLKEWNECTTNWNKDLLVGDTLKPDGFWPIPVGVRLKGHFADEDTTEKRYVPPFTTDVNLALEAMKKAGIKAFTIHGNNNGTSCWVEVEVKDEKPPCYCHFDTFINRENKTIASACAFAAFAFARLNKERVYKVGKEARQ